MSKYDDAMKIMTEKYGKDEVWSIATTDGESYDVRFVDGYYEDGLLYIVTYALSTKMQHIEVEPNIPICTFWFKGHGIGENLGWVRDEKNANIMEKLRVAFASWYSNGHINEEDPNTILLCIHITDGAIIDEEQKYDEFYYEVDFVNKTVE